MISVPAKDSTLPKTIIECGRDDSVVIPSIRVTHHLFFHHEKSERVSVI